MPTPRFHHATLAKLACVYSGITWGLFWFPVRWLEAAGIEGAWVGVVFYSVQLAFLVPFVVLNPGRMRASGPGLILTSFFAGGALALYGFAILYTEVIRAMLLFYLTPVWSTLLACWLLKLPITRLRWGAIALAFAGILVIFGIDIGVPWPRNAGDWFGLASGLFWAMAAVRLNLDRDCDPIDITFGFFAWAAIFSAAGLLLPLSSAPAPAWETLASVMIWLLPLLALIAVPGAYAAMWGARLIDPGIVGILFMGEIVVGTITVAIWAGEPFGAREIIGCALIVAAGMIESVWDVWHGRKRPQD